MDQLDTSGASVTTASPQPQDSPKPQTNPATTVQQPPATTVQPSPAFAVPPSPAPTQPTQTSTSQPQPVTPTPQSQLQTSPSSPQSTTPKFKIDFTLDPRTKLTVQWSAILFGAAELIKAIASYISQFFLGGIAGEIMRSFGNIFGNVPVGMFIREVIWGVITGAIAGFILSKFYPFIQDWNRRYLKGRLNTMFKLLFYPALAGSILGFFLGSAFSFAFGIGSILVTTIGVIVADLLYAKILSAKIAGLYEPPA